MNISENSNEIERRINSERNIMGVARRRNRKVF